MKIAIVTITEQGVITASKVIESLPYSCDLFVHEHSICAKSCTKQFKRLKELLPEIWGSYSLLIFIMATGIVVRQIAPWLEKKDKDPAVLVMDDSGKFVISLLSGHLGGANAWTRYIAHQIQSTAVITTATDGNGIIAPDEYARRFNWNIAPLENLPQVNRTLLENKNLTVYSEYIIDESHPFKQDSHYLFVAKENREKANIVISPFINPSMDKNKNQVCLIPKTIALGIGCRKETRSEKILEFIESILINYNLSKKALKGIYSVDIKANEEGLIQAATHLGIPFQTFTCETIQEINNKFNLGKSEFVLKKIGVDGVCEAASLLGTYNGELIVKKVMAKGMTIAISQEKSLLSESVQEIPLI